MCNARERAARRVIEAGAPEGASSERERVVGRKRVPSLQLARDGAGPGGGDDFERRPSDLEAVALAAPVVGG